MVSSSLSGNKIPVRHYLKQLILINKRDFNCCENNKIARRNR
jgi:hypothetical protein